MTMPLPAHYTIHSSFDPLAEVWRNHVLLFQGTTTEVERWISVGCPLTAIEWDEIRTENGWW